jgi:bifunctional enzyme CysN/CysC
VFEALCRQPDLGGFILIDKLTNATVAAGMLHFSLRRAQNVHWQAIDIEPRGACRAQEPEARVLWFTGLSGSGKSTIANLVEKKLTPDEPPHLPARRRQCPPRAEQGSRLHRCRPDREYPPRRRGRQADGRCRPDRDHRLHLAVPRRARDGARDAGAGEFVEIFVDTPLPRRREARREGPLQEGAGGQLKNFTGIDSPYEAPENPRSGSTR